MQLLKKSKSPWERALNSVASGTLTYSKQPCRYVDGVYPQYISHGSGCFLVDTKGSTYIDYVCGLGTNILGYAHSKVTEVVTNQLKKGTLFSLPNEQEYKLAEKIKSMIPSIELVRYLKSGSEAVSAGIKIARAYTGRDIVLSNGYHGWHDWSTPITEQNLGTPKSYQSAIIPFEYGNLDSIGELLKTYDVACIVLDPYIFDEPPVEYFGKLIKLARRHKALVLFDEVVTGLRWSKFSVQNTYNVNPDLTALGKTMANGIPMACIGGKKSIMKVLDNGCFVSSTYGGDLVGISASLATLDIIESEGVPDMLYESGNLLIDGLNAIGLNVDGSPFRQRMKFRSLEHKALFWQECVKRGVLFGAAQHTSYSHTIKIIEKTLDIAKEAYDVCKLYEDNPKIALDGKVPQAVSTIANLRK